MTLEELTSRWRRYEERKGSPIAGFELLQALHEPGFLSPFVFRNIRSSVLERMLDMVLVQLTVAEYRFFVRLSLHELGLRISFEYQKAFMVDGHQGWKLVRGHSRKEIICNVAEALIAFLQTLPIQWRLS